MVSGSPSNPFSAVLHDPSRTEYIFPEGRSVGDFADRLEAAGWRAEFVGPHGVGKSTLLHTVRREADRRGLRTALFRCSDQARDLPADFAAHLAWAHICFLDGGERLRRPELRLLMIACRALRRGLVITTHARIGWGEQVEVRVGEEAIHRLAGAAGPEALAQLNGNARAALERLYDNWEAARALD